MKKYYLLSAMVICFQLINLAPLFGQSFVLDTVLTSGSGTWKPKKPGIKSFYVQVWGGGAGGNGNYGGGGSQYSKSTDYTVNVSSYSSGYPYTVAAGANANTNGNPSNFEGIWAAGGKTNGVTGGLYFGGNILVY